MSKIRRSRKHWYWFRMPYGPSNQPINTSRLLRFKYPTLPGKGVLTLPLLQTEANLHQSANASRSQRKSQTSLSLVPAFGRQHCWTVNSSEKGFYGLEWQKNTTRDSINISLKLYCNINVKGDFKYLHSAKINFNRSCRMNIKSQVPNSNYTTQTEGGLPVVILARFSMFRCLYL